MSPALLPSSASPAGQSLSMRASSAGTSSSAPAEGRSSSAVATSCRAASAMPSLQAAICSASPGAPGMARNCAGLRLLKKLSCPGDPVRRSPAMCPRQAAGKAQEELVRRDQPGRRRCPASQPQGSLVTPCLFPGTPPARPSRRNRAGGLAEQARENVPLAELRTMLFEIETLLSAPAGTLPGCSCRTTIG